MASLNTEQRTTGVGKWCLGHGVQGQAESLRLGHYVEPYLVGDLFSHHKGEAGTKGFGTTLQPRCVICRSVRQWHDHEANARKRASGFLRQHAERWVKLHRADDIVSALMQMDTGGITVGAITALIVDSIGKTCPGLCAHEEPEGLVFHIIDRVAGGQVDVKDPSQPLSLEQLHFLCNSCNQAKGDMPWAEFVYRRRAALRAWEGARVNPAYRASEQPALGLWATP